MNSIHVLFAFLPFNIGIVPVAYARGGPASSDASMALPLIVVFLAVFWAIAAFIENANPKEKEDSRSPSMPLVVISAVASIIVTFISALVFEYKWVGVGAIMGAVILFASYGLIYRSLR